ncbi:tRNA (cytidine/uridine-2'-O-)-methyltransferase [Litorimonas taeanensis]|uniref:tRNA (cytidine(34)-2'-O)-methyltransferase n=1 Tax=Litorimonas taeanensis TaxID=568099 RepID=A0A420WFK0_9PROT|nr:tRNA (cytidine(34)-2'-O)-methyltransferase [Litorimonas taeanensis]RKQ69770.1 tRNA (cytidine/uridine-2'-O-)-methyltransferase [Litorimonas taeanensis]
MNVTLYQPDIAANLGAIMRLCAGFDIPLSVIEPCGFPLSEKALRRAAMDYEPPGGLQRITSWESYASKGRTVLLTTKGATPLSDFVFQDEDTLLFGRESAGVPDEVHAASDARVIIPIAVNARSFNLATSVAITLFEALRQTKALP